MPIKLFDTVWIVALIITPILSLLWIFINIIKNYRSGKISLLPIARYIILFILSILTSLIMMVLIGRSLSTVPKRQTGIYILKEMHKSNEAYYIKNKKHAKTFKDIGLSGSGLRDVLYTYYFNNDRIYHPSVEPYDFPSSIKREDDVIYAIGKIILYSKFDILAINTKGTIIVIQSAAWWLPY